MYQYYHLFFIDLICLQKHDKQKWSPEPTPKNGARPKSHTNRKNNLNIMPTYKVKYKMKGQAWTETTVQASSGQLAQQNVKSMMGPDCENAAAGILISN